MKFTTTTALLAAALGVSAHPSGHAHKHMHRSVEERADFVMAQKPPPAPTTTSTTVVPVPTTSTTSYTPPTTTSSEAAPASSHHGHSGGNHGGSGGAPAFCTSKSKRATEAQIMYEGNTGDGGNYGCNLMPIDAQYKDSYDFVVTFEDTSGKDQICEYWNKYGSDGKLDGFFKGFNAGSINVPANGKAYMAIDKNSQWGAACGPGGPPTTSIGQFASTWVEGDAHNESNGGCSGQDASILVAAAAGMKNPYMKVSGLGEDSTIYADGTGDNAYTAGMEAEDGVGGTDCSSQVRLLVQLG